ncbi:pyrroline-5-carboxylate reductase family protein [Sneathiella limimaris]|uniref:pyrroline-5-carboxylate reductase family protein n=1 Tax=Sneathiella limimaris TaxID=1964213 RepID=UPI00146C769E|nr:pyrroline-5-carboxylate reductase dimerization domain-containing protein [Sneathiella limimaris]
MSELDTVGVIGGTGELGSSLIKGFLKAGTINPQKLWVSNRSGKNDTLISWPDINFTTDNQILADQVNTLILCVPPALFSKVQIDAKNKLVISVMAGVSSDQIAEQTGARRIVKAISNPAAHLGSAYSAYCCRPTVSELDQAFIEKLFSSCGLVDQVETEDHVDHFTALTGPVPGYVAYFADAMSLYAQNQGIPVHIANRAVRQLIAGSGRIFEQSEKAPETYVQEMIDYVGTTAAGLNIMKETSIVEDVQKGIAAAYQKTKSIS